MPRQLIFIQGGGAGARELDALLADDLAKRLGPDWHVRYPEMPNESDPDAKIWKRAIAKEIEASGDGAVLVGHSLGGTMLASLLTENSQTRPAAGIFFISTPFVGKGGWPNDDVAPLDNLGSKLPRDIPIFFYQGDEDEIAPPAHADFFARAVPQAKVRRLAGRDHQLNNDLSEVADDIERVAARDRLASVESGTQLPLG